MAIAPAVLQGAGLALFAINNIVGTGFQLWQQAKQVYGDQIPSWESIIQDNQRLQQKIDAEEGKSG